MFPWQDMLQLMISGVVAVYFEPMFWLVILLIIYQYWQVQKSQRRMLGVDTFSLPQQVTMTIFFGSVGGIIGSFLLTLMGVNLSQLGLSYIWPVAIVLMAINMRYLCFAYAGGLVALSKVLFGWPIVDVPQVLVFVAILHITESLLIVMSGRYGNIPVILRRTDGQLVGAFNLQNFWPLPLVLMSAVAVPNAKISASMISMPDWWPLLPVVQALPEGHQWMYAMIPVVAALGYTDLAIASSPQRRRCRSAMYLAIYSLTLLTVALLSVQYKWLQLTAALLSPLGHELFIQFDSRQEFESSPHYVPPAQGVMILDTVIDSPAYKAGLQPGDILLNVHGLPIDHPRQLASALETAPHSFIIELLRNGRIKQRKIKMVKEKTILGVILVPSGDELHYIELVEDKFLLWEWCKKVMRKNK
ncbi:PDZ domain-containing protein [Pelosinus sp. sgz500959]|uniref:PDZ domain-containing protein n=1 Tax=Pelosinus sp. sgz500959 TaxID=3242472 RepID=UPI00366B220B